MPVTLKKSKKGNSPMKYLNKVTLPKKEDKKEDVSNINIFVSSRKSSCDNQATQSGISITDVLNSPLFCPAVNDCILSGIDVVSNDIGNIIIAGSDNGAFLDENTINTLIENNTDITTLESRVTVLEGDSHVPAVINGNGIVTSVPSGVDNQTFQLGLNIGQLPSTDSNNQVVLGTDGKLYVAQTTISTSGFNFVNTIADRDAQTVSDGHITQVIAAINPNDNGFYIYDSATTSWIELIPNATVISVNGHTGVVVLIPSDLAYVATISGTPVTNVQEALDAIKDFLNNFDNNVADSITNSLAVQTALENFIENTNFTLLGDITFQDNTVTFDNSTVNFENGTTLNYDSTVVSNHNGDTTNYNNATINSTNTEYNHTGDTINYDSTTTVEGGVFTNNEFNNPTFTGNIGLNVKYKNVELSGQIAGATYTLPTTPSGDIQVSIKGGIIQSEITPDYAHTANATTFTMVADRTGQIVMVSYIEAVMSPSPIIPTGGIIAGTTNNIVSTGHVSTGVNQLVLSKVSNINGTIRLADTTGLGANMTYKKNGITLVSGTSGVSVDTSVVVGDVIELFISSGPTVSGTATISFSFDYSGFMT